MAGPARCCSVNGTAPTSKASAAGVANLRPSVSRIEFDAAVASIHALIEAGESYQVNYTYRLHAQQYGSPLGLYVAGAASGTFWRADRPATG